MDVVEVRGVGDHAWDNHGDEDNHSVGDEVSHGHGVHHDITEVLSLKIHFFYQNFKMAPPPPQGGIKLPRQLEIGGGGG